MYVMLWYVCNVMYGYVWYGGMEVWRYGYIYIIYIYIHGWMHACMHACTDVHGCAWMCMVVMCMYVHVCVCMCMADYGCNVHVCL